MRERRPYLNEALKNEIRPAAKITLRRASRDPHDRGNPRECKAEQEREAKAIEQSGKDIAALIVGSEPVPFNIPAVALGLSRVEALRGGAALCFAKHPGRRRRRGHRQLAVDGFVGIADWRPHHEAMLGDLLGNPPVAIIGLREKAAKLLFRIIM